MSQEILVALEGNPNVGKSTVFNTLTGMRQHVGNWPGKTVERKEGVCRFGDRVLRVVDLPGTYSLTAYSIEEMVARDFIFHGKPDVTVDIVDASNLERNLYLTIQTLELTDRVVVALNMMDVAEARGLTIDVQSLSKTLGVPVVPTVADKGRGIRSLLSTIVDLANGKITVGSFKLDYGSQLEGLIGELEAPLNGADLSSHSPRWVAVKLLERDFEAFELVKGLKSMEGVLKRIGISQTLEGKMHERRRF